MGIKVFMIGGRRCGKTSALSVMFDQFVNGRASSFFTINDQTQLELGKLSPISNKLEDQDPLLPKKYELMHFLVRPTSSTFLVDSGPTYCMWTYTLRLAIPGHPRKRTTIDFFDCPGEYFQDPKYTQDVQQQMRESDVFVIVVDTPYLMEGSQVVGRAVNCVDSVQNFVSSIDNDNNNGVKAKMVMFVPIKCEKWVKEGRINEVVDKIKTEYAVPIQTVMAYRRMNVCILPIETAGNIIFSELREPFVITRQGQNEKVKCCKLTDTLVRLKDGSPRTKIESDSINTDPDAVIEGLGIIRPHSWFHINPNADPNNLYAPYNCEQLPLHILSFMTRKMAEEGDGWLYTLIFGGISKGEMERKMEEIEAAGLIKNNTEGIEYLKKDI